MKGRGP